MSKEEALKDFLNTLKISFKNASMYGTEHPAFSESVTKLKDKTDALFGYFIPISLGFTSNSLYIDDRHWEKSQLFVEVARTFHFRKLKKIELIEDVSLFARKKLMAFELWFGKNSFFPFLNVRINHK